MIVPTDKFKVHHLESRTLEHLQYQVRLLLRLHQMVAIPHQVLELLLRVVDPLQVVVVVLRQVVEEVVTNVTRIRWFFTSSATGIF